MLLFYCILDYYLSYSGQNELLLNWDPNVVATAKVNNNVLKELISSYFALIYREVPDRNELSSRNKLQEYTVIRCKQLSDSQDVNSALLLQTPLHLFTANFNNFLRHDPAYRATGEIGSE